MHDRFGFRLFNRFGGLCRFRCCFGGLRLSADRHDIGQKRTDFRFRLWFRFNRFLNHRLRNRFRLNDRFGIGFRHGFNSRFRIGFGFRLNNRLGDRFWLGFDFLDGFFTLLTVFRISTFFGCFGLALGRLTAAQRDADTLNGPCPAPTGRLRFRHGKNDPTDKNNTGQPGRNQEINAFRHILSVLVLICLHRGHQLHLFDSQFLQPLQKGNNAGTFCGAVSTNFDWTTGIISR